MELSVLMYPVEFYAKRNSFCNGDCMYRMDAVVFDIILKGLAPVVRST